MGKTPSFDTHGAFSYAPLPKWEFLPVSMEAEENNFGEVSCILFFYSPGLKASPSVPLGAGFSLFCILNIEFRITNIEQQKLLRQ